VLLAVTLCAALAVHAAPRTSSATAAGLRNHTATKSAMEQSVAEGGLTYVTFGCETCHGLYGRGGVRVPNISGAATIPALNTSVVRNSLSAAALQAIIQHGIVARVGTRVYMPVWGAVMSKHQINTLVAYIKAGLPPVPGVMPQTVRTDLGLAVEGQQLYVRNGCVICHAFNGWGGVPNPSSPDKLIPPLRGAAFDQQFAKDSDIAYVIEHGSIIGQPPIVSMPVWKGLISDQQVKAIVAYLRTLR
jgi:mono/diheme cytochrome c family protein